MTDFDYDCMQKKRIAQGARHRKCGSKSRMCFLSTDHMTHKQWKERNGSCMTMNLNKPMNWENFKLLPAGMQTEYLQHITDTYKVGKFKIAKELFGCSDNTLAKYITDHSLPITFCSVSGAKPKDQAAAWKTFLGVKEAAVDQPQVVPEAVPEKPEETDSPVPEKTVMKMDSVSIRFNGKLDIQMVANSLRHIVGDGATGTLTIMFSSKDVVAES